MKTTLTEGTYHGINVLRFKAVIPKNVEHGIPRRIQKTWRAELGHPMFDRKVIKSMFDREAQRWLRKKMAELFPTDETKHELYQMEIPNEPDVKSNEGPAVPDM